MLTVRGYEELPQPADDGVGRRFEFVRSDSDPHYLIQTRTGDVFIRRDGKRWEWPAYQVERSYEKDQKTDGKIDLRSATVWAGEDHRYQGADA